MASGQHGTVSNQVNLDGASLIYVSSSIPHSLSTLIYSSLGITSPLKRQSLKHNIIDRDRILIPPNWDSWGKILVLREGFDVEGISEAWTMDIRSSEHQSVHNGGDSDITDVVKDNEEHSTHQKQNTQSLKLYETRISDPKNRGMSNQNNCEPGLKVKKTSIQDFLAGQLGIMEQLKFEEEQTREDKNVKNSGHNFILGTTRDGNLVTDEKYRINDHIGPVQFNLGGIQVDAEDMLKRLQDREKEENPQQEILTSSHTDGKQQNEALANFFADLMKPRHQAN